MGTVKMKNYDYIALVIKDVGGFSVIFPDLESCMTQGETLQQAYDNAKDVLGGYVSYMVEQGLPLPKPSTKAEIMARAETEKKKTLDEYDYWNHVTSDTIMKLITAQLQNGPMLN